jgi:hypothetical protein
VQLYSVLRGVVPYDIGSCEVSVAIRVNYLRSLVGRQLKVVVEAVKLPLPKGEIFTL